MTQHHMPRATLESTAGDEALIRQLVEQVERTFDTEGRAKAMAAVADLLRRLDPATLKALAIQREVDAEEVERET